MSGNTIKWSSSETNADDTPDLSLGRAAAGVLKIYNGFTGNGKIKNLEVSAGTSTEGDFPIKLYPGSLLTTAETGAVEFDGTHFYATISGTRKQLDNETLAPGSAASLQSTVDFGFASAGEGDVARVTVATASVSTSSIIVCSPAQESTSDHDPEDAAIEGIVASAGNIVDGVSFDIIARAPNGTFGQYKINSILV